MKRWYLHTTESSTSTLTHNISQVVNLRLQVVSIFSTSLHVDSPPHPTPPVHCCHLSVPLFAVCQWLWPVASVQDHFSVFVLLWFLHPSPAEHWDPACSPSLVTLASLPGHLCMDSAWFRQRTCLSVWFHVVTARTQVWFTYCQPFRVTLFKKPFNFKVTFSHHLSSLTCYWLHLTHETEEPDAGTTASEEEQHCSTRKHLSTPTLYVNTNTVWVIIAD